MHLLLATLVKHLISWISCPSLHKAGSIILADDSVIAGPNNTTTLSAEASAYMTAADTVQVTAAEHGPRLSHGWVQLISLGSGTLSLSFFSGKERQAIQPQCCCC